MGAGCVSAVAVNLALSVGLLAKGTPEPCRSHGLIGGRVILEMALF
jgi:hypothetical protein